MKIKSWCVVSLHTLVLARTGPHSVPPALVLQVVPEPVDVDFFDPQGMCIACVRVSCALSTL